MSAAAVSLQRLRRVFGDTTAVDGLTFDVPPGTLFGIVGPDGAGKTTTLRILAGVLRPSGGTAFVHGVDVGKDPEKVKPGIAYMAQRFGLYEDLTVEENLDFYADLYGVARRERPARLKRLYDFSGLGPFRTRRTGALSGGMKQKLSLSCCLVHRPRVLLLDEPTFGVDPISRRELWTILHEMVSEGVTVVLTTSYLDEAERCDRVAMLDAGGLLALDDPRTLRASLSGTVWSIRVDRPRAARDLLRADARVENASLFGEEIHAVTQNDVTASAVADILSAGGGVTTGDDDDIRVIEPSLEDVFIQLVGEHRGGGDA
ncbi:MAG: ABC transporter ATP-binding protein [Gemmatimonadota bacterium]|nr:ABC transporter ATP-binding protein [Gemmatimonadota bacterium]